MDKAGLPSKPWEAMSRGEKLAASADRALDVAKAYLDAPPDPNNLKLASLQKELALGVIGYQLRAEQAQLPQAQVEVSTSPSKVRIILAPDDPLLGQLNDHGTLPASTDDTVAQEPK